MQKLRHAIIHSEHLKRLYAPQKNLVCMVIETEPGEDVMIKLLEYCASNKISLLSTSITLHPESPRAFITSIIDVTSLERSLSEIVREIRGLPFVYRVEILETPMTLGKARLITFTLRELSSIIKGAYEKFQEAGAVFLFFLGYEIGLDIAEDIAKKYSDYDALNHFLFWARALGWLGDYKIVKYIDKKEIVIEVKDLFECMIFYGEKKFPSSNLFRGLLAGFVSALWNKKIEVEESLCVSKGDHVCRFIVKAD
ncbi:MAG: hypothetical protein DRJ52_07750 [Thermoprotei archaeon]|nr:MAG: hypothetical protein DRJ52_07750 [Thermoprotei archaeon]RLE99866.1 MAG: hypothetical protein DRJ63_04015 [Thermoprotei archaeon]HDI75158.1 hypothetical protein [Thermoprotei archaeon]